MGAGAGVPPGGDRGRTGCQPRGGRGDAIALQKTASGKEEEAALVELRDGVGSGTSGCELPINKCRLGMGRKRAGHRTDGRKRRLWRSPASQEHKAELWQWFGMALVFIHYCIPSLNTVCSTARLLLITQEVLSNPVFLHFARDIFISSLSSCHRLYMQFLPC